MMNQLAKQHDVKPWYRHFWPWVLIGVPAASVAGSMLMIHLATSDHDGVVREFYHKELRSVMEVTAPDELAASMGLSAELRIDTETGDVGLSLSSRSGMLSPDTLTLLLVHPTRASIDSELRLTHLRNGHYAGQLKSNIHGRRQLQLLPTDNRWRLKLERAYFPLQEPLELRATNRP